MDGGFRHAGAAGSIVPEGRVFEGGIGHIQLIRAPVDDIMEFDVVCPLPLSPR